VQFRFDDQLIDTERRELRRGGALVKLEPQVFDLLLYLVQNRDRVVSKDDLLEAVWGGRIVSESALSSRITAVRKAIGDEGRTQHLIRTLPRRGLRFIGSVEEVKQRATPGDTATMVMEGPARAEFALPEKPSIAVMPLDNLSGDPEQEDFADTMVEERVERRLAAILAADVAGYTRLMEADEEGTLAALRAIRGDLGNPNIAEYHGRIVKTTGDGILVEFASVVDAVRYAVELQRAMAERNTDLPPAKRIEFRIGIHQGDVIVEDGDIFGDRVNLAVRLEGLAEPGGICVSRVVREEIRDKLDVSFEDLGAQEVKNISRPVRVFRAQLGTPKRPRRRRRSSISTTSRRLR